LSQNPGGPLSPSDTVKHDSAANAIDTAFYEYKVLPQSTDSMITPSAEPHYAYLDTRMPAQNRLVLFLGGTKSHPADFQQFCRIAASLGFHVVNVNYPNTISTLICADKTNIECFENFRREILFGTDVSEYVNVDPANSIINRTVKLLQYLHHEHPGQKWDQYFHENALNFDAIIVAGHSQGGGHAAYLAYQYSVNRLIMFSAPADYSERYSQPAPWCENNFQTAADRFYGLMHKRDEIVPASEQYAIWKSMKMLMQDDTVSADGNAYQSHRALYTNFNPNPDAPTARLKHNVPAMDITLPSGDAGEQLKKVWAYLLTD